MSSGAMPRTQLETGLKGVEPQRNPFKPEGLKAHSITEQ